MKKDIEVRAMQGRMEAQQRELIQGEMRRQDEVQRRQEEEVKRMKVE